MAVYLDENFVGSDDVIGFPHLVLCLGFVLIGTPRDRAGATLWGVHLTDTENSGWTFDVFRDWCLEACDVESITAIYGCCNRQVRYGGLNPTQAWRDEMLGFADRIGFSGPVRGFDTGIIDPRDGTYVEYVLNPLAGDSCRIFYKRHEKIRYTPGENARGLRIRRAMRSVEEFNTLPEALKRKKRIQASVAPTIEEDTPFADGARARKNFWNFNKRTMHEVDYAMRLDEISAL